MNNENFHPILTEPPVAHALHHWDAQKGLLRYEYNGVDIVEVQVPAGTELGFRHGSDGSMQSVQYVQQIYIASEIPCTAKITLRLHEDARNMRPYRAKDNYAILGTLPGLVSYGVNGMYDAIWDFMIDWYGRPWRWLDTMATSDGAGFATVSFEADLSLSALYMNFKPLYYSRHLGYQYHHPWHKRTSSRTAAGWCSWEAYRRDISIDKIRDVAKFLQHELAPYGMEYLQVDDGYQAMPLPFRAEGTMSEGWMTCDPKKFPDGHDSIVKAICAEGLTPAIWVNANITNPKFPEQHPDAVLWKDEKPLKGEWIDFLYACDAKTLAEQVEPIFRAMREAGYRYIKIDAIRHLLFDGLHECVRLGLLTNDEAERRFRAFMEATRRGMGDDVYYLASWGEMHEVVGVADACRISMDANPTWAGVRMQLFESARWFHTHRVLFVNDPDHVCVRSDTEWVKSILSLISLSGELYMLSDALNAYTPEKLDIIRKTLPPLQTCAGETGQLDTQFPAYTWTKLHGFAVQSHESPVEMEQVSAQEAKNIGGWSPDQHNRQPFSTLWSFAMHAYGQQWRVILRVATNPLVADELPLDHLALNPQKRYHAFDFWSQQYLGIVSETVSVRELSLGHCQVISLHEFTGMPQLLGSDRHVSMDAVSVLEHHASANALHLTLAGEAGFVQTYSLWLPDGATALQVSGCHATLTPDDDCYRLRVEFDNSRAQIDVQCININAHN